GRYYSLAGADVARVLEALGVLAGSPRSGFIPRTPERLRAARTCYDHLAGALGVALHDRLKARGWITVGSAERCEVTAAGERGLAGFGVELAALRRSRRRLAYECLDWSERRPHLGGALGAALLDLCLERRWVRRERDDRVVHVTPLGARELPARF